MLPETGTVSRFAWASDKGSEPSEPIFRPPAVRPYGNPFVYVHGNHKLR
jgi:hypothetical protein